ncbi:hypothetical protein [Maribacter aestuarii]|uniref:hypothetical protein n=1 Tax=Maribacter aestuarii TaxID=1130723 RepID=UPI00248C6A5B|nr:hypothetical protein [Maribacter aestuarii]
MAQNPIEQDKYEDTAYTSAFATTYFSGPVPGTENLNQFFHDMKYKILWCEYLTEA